MKYRTESAESNERASLEETDTYALGHPGTVLDSIRQRVTLLRNDVNGRNPIVVREVEAVRHGVVCVDVEFASVGYGSVAKNAEMVGFVRVGEEANAHRWPAYTCHMSCDVTVIGNEGRTVFVFDFLEALAEDVIHVYQLGMTGVCHSVVTDEDDIHNVCQIARFDLKLKIFRKRIHVN